MIRKARISMTEGRLLPNIIAYTVPIILTGILQLLYNAADLIVVGRFCGSTSVGAVGATSSLTTLLVNFFMGFAGGSSVVVAQAAGAKDDDFMSKAVHTAIPLAIICGAILTVLGMVYCEPLLRLMKTPENVLPLSALYMKCFFGGMVFNLVYNFAAAILRAVGDTKSPLKFLTIAGLVNVVLNVVFVTLFRMDVAGVAIATVISQAISAVLCVLALTRREDASCLFFDRIKIHKEALFKIIKIGLPSGIQASVFAISNVIIQSATNSLGDVYVVGKAAASSIDGFIYITMNGFYHTSLAFSGQNYGAKNFGRLKEVFKKCLVCVFICGITLGSLVMIFSRPLLSIYITDSAEAIEAGRKVLAYIGVPYFVCGMMEVTTGAMRGIGASLSSMLISIIGVCGIRLTWIFTVFSIPRFHNADGLFVSYAISWAVTAAIQVIVYLIILKKKEKEALV